MNQKLIGQVFLQKGRIDFSREDNPWAFSRIDAGMKESQRDRIFVDPKQASIELKSAPINQGEVPLWMSSMQDILRTADSMHLQFKSGVLRFRRATHVIESGKEFVTLGNQEEFDFYASSHWKRIRYLYAVRRPRAHCFDVNTLISWKENAIEAIPNARRIEIPSRIDVKSPDGEVHVSFDSSGTYANPEIVEWRGRVNEGEIGRFSPENSFVEFSVNQVLRPFTFLHENRQEFSNHAYTFNTEKTRTQFKGILKKRLANSAP